MPCAVQCGAVRCGGVMGLDAARRGRYVCAINRPLRKFNVYFCGTSGRLFQLPAR